MAYSRIKNFSFQDINGTDYNLEYDPTNGNVRVIEKGASQSSLPIYQDGSFTNLGSTLSITQQQQDSIHNSIIDLVKTAHTNVGGNAKNAVLPQWVQNNSPVSATSTDPSKNTSSQNNGNSNGQQSSGGPFGLGNLANGIFNLQDNLDNVSITSGQFGAGNEKELFGDDLIYPNDMDIDQQDYFQISQYKYRPSAGTAIFSRNFSALDGGIQRDSNLQELVGMTFLPMPNKVADGNSVNWGPDSMNNLSAALAGNTLGDPGGALAAMVTGSIAGVGGGTGLLIKNLIDLASNGGVSQNLGTLAGSSLASKILKMQGQGIETESILARGAGIVPNSNLDLLFNGPTLREFSFTYRLSPRSSTEASTVRRIIRFFKQGMAAKKKTASSGSASFFLGTPNVFKLEYKTNNNRLIDGVNRFKTCALTKFNCDYTPDQVWAAYESGQPVSVSITMSFVELEPVFDTDYQKNVLSSRNDLSAVNNESVGY